jgi:UDP-N-acetylmuramoyl-tripeptide--D-alanyl-D-alanine ligase
VTFWTADRVAAALGTSVPAGAGPFAAVGTDTRSIGAGQLFVALVGDRFDGHAFLNAAKAGGAAAAVVRRGTSAVAGLPLIPVDDTLVALGRLARARRDTVTGPVVAVTGTNGKTSTKEMLHRALATRWRVHATDANLNNLVGVPLTILAAPPGTEALVVEAGASVPGEIARARDIIAPTVGVVTNVSAGHVQGFGSVAGVLAEKVALLKDVVLAVVGTEPPELAERARAVAQRVFSAGLAASADVHPDRWSLTESGHARIIFRGHETRLPLVGRHQAENAMLVLAVAAVLELDLERVTRALTDVHVPSGRGEVIEVGGLTILHDAYNANPASLAAALETAAAMRGTRRLVIVVGSMLELGAETAALHAEAAEAVVAARPDIIAAVGEFVAPLKRHTELGDHLVTATDAEELGKKLAPRIKGNELVLLKASRGVRLERVLPHLLST